MERTSLGTKLFASIANAAGEFCFLETTLEIVEVQE